MREVGPGSTIASTAERRPSGRVPVEDAADRRVLPRFALFRRHTLTVECRRDLPQRKPTGPESVDLAKDGLFGRVLDEQHAIVGQPKAEGDAARDPLSLAPLVPKASRVLSPIASRSHWPTDISTFSTSRPAADLVSIESETENSCLPARSPK